MAITRKAVRQAAIQRIGAGLVSTATGGAAQTLVAGRYPFQDTAGPNDEFEGWWLLKLPGAAGEETRRISATTRSSGTLTHGGPAWTANPVNADEFELHRYDPTLWNRAINLTLTKCFYTEREYIAHVVDQREYALSGYSWITQESRVKNLYLTKRKTPNERNYEPWARWGRWWRIRRDAAVFTLEIHPPFGALADDQLNGAINASVTTITVDSTSGFLSEGYILIESEIISYTATTSTTFTGCVRGQDGSTAATHADDVAVRQIEILVLEGVRPYAELTTDTDATTGTTSCPDELVIAGAIYHLNYLLELAEIAHNRGQGEPYRTLRLDALPEYQRLLRQYAPETISSAIQFSYPFAGPAPLRTR